MKLGGNFFEDLGPGQRLINPVPRTVTEGDVALYIALTGDRNPLHCSDEFARSLGFERAPVHDLLVFHIVFGRAVGEISLNSPGNLGYADLRFLRPVYTGDTLRATTETLGWRETSKGDTGVVWVRTVGLQPARRGRAAVLSLGDGEQARARRRRRTPTTRPRCRRRRRSTTWRSRRSRASTRRRRAASASGRTTSAGERIAHPQGMTIEEAEHQMATRLYQNTARVHFNQHQQNASRHGRRIVYGGHVISVAHALSFDGLENVRRHRRLERRLAHEPDVRRRHAVRLDRRARAHRPRPRRHRRAAAAAGGRQERRPEPGGRAAEGGGRRRPRALPRNVVLDLDYMALMPEAGRWRSTASPTAQTRLEPSHGQREHEPSTALNMRPAT